MKEPFLKKERSAKEVELFRKIIECIANYKIEAKKIYGDKSAEVDVKDVLIKLFGHYKVKGNFWNKKKSEEKKPLVVIKNLLDI